MNYGTFFIFVGSQFAVTLPIRLPLLGTWLETMQGIMLGVVVELMLRIWWESML